MLLIAAAMIAAPTPAPAAAATKAPTPLATSPACPRTTSYYAWQRGKSVAPQKLNQLPPATAYMAVFRRIGGCEAPLTMVDYRNSSRR